MLSTMFQWKGPRVADLCRSFSRSVLLLDKRPVDVKIKRCKPKQKKDGKKCLRKKDKFDLDCKVSKCTEKSTAPTNSEHGGSFLVYKALSLFLSIPLLAGTTYILFGAEHHHERLPFVRYPYMRKREKKFPWGDGNHTFFHNPDINALPEGYEDEIDK